MRSLFGMSILGLVSSGPIAAENLALCKDGLAWSAATYVWTSSNETQDSVSIQRYSNGARIDIKSPGQEKSLIMLETGEQLFRGTESGIRDFMFADIAAGAPLHYLQKKFATPCDATRATDFTLRMNKDDRSSGGADMVTGKIQAQGDSLTYTLVFHSDNAQKGAKTLHGKWSAATITPIPPDTAIAGWSLQRQNAPAIERVRAKSIQALHALRGTDGSARK